MKTYVCPKCGKEFPKKAPERCPYCLCPSDEFTYYGEIEENENSQSSKIGVENKTVNQYSAPMISNADEESVRTGANIVFVAAMLIAVICIFFGLKMLSDGGLIPLAIGSLLVGTLFILVGWIHRAFIRLFANMSERLSSIDNKIK